jgi:hypothetical protein
MKEYDRLFSVSWSSNFHEFIAVTYYPTSILSIIRLINTIEWYYSSIDWYCSSIEWYYSSIEWYYSSIEWNYKLDMTSI